MSGLMWTILILYLMNMLVTVPALLTGKVPNKGLVMLFSFLPIYCVVSVVLVLTDSSHLVKEGYELIFKKLIPLDINVPGLYFNNPEITEVKADRKNQLEALKLKYNAEKQQIKSLSGLHIEEIKKSLKQSELLDQLGLTTEDLELIKKQRIAPLAKSKKEADHKRFG